MAFSSDGRTLASASADQTVIFLWDVRNPDRPYQLGPPLTGHIGAVNGVAFAPNRRTIATASADETVILWQLPRLDTVGSGEAREACLRAGGPLNKATWGLYAPGVSYQDTCARH
jgi:WD40 repeat protein